MRWGRSLEKGGRSLEIEGRSLEMTERERREGRSQEMIEWVCYSH